MSFFFREEWYKLQSARWKALEERGWRFDPPPFCSCDFVGISMRLSTGNFQWDKPSASATCSMVRPRFTWSLSDFTNFGKVAKRSATVR